LGSAGRILRTGVAGRTSQAGSRADPGEPQTAPDRFHDHGRFAGARTRGSSV